MTLYGNRSAADLVRNVFYNHARRGDVVCAASPYFSNAGLLLELAERGCNVRLVVRLGPSTLPKALGKCLRHEAIQIRYFTSRRFHSKVYVFGDRMAIVGSANLTEAGVQSNTELCVGVTPTGPDFEEITSIFQSYWNAAAVLTPERLSTYAKLYESLAPNTAEAHLEQQLAMQLGDVVPQLGIRASTAEPAADQVFLENYRRTYQEFLAAYRSVEAAYKEDGRRLQPEERVPLRIEIDLFLSFIRETFTRGDDFEQQPLRDAAGVAAFAAEHFDKWFTERWPYLDNHIPDHYARIVRVLGARASIMQASAEELFFALDVCHSFHDRLRFYKGGHDTMRAAFLADNDVAQVRRVLCHLLHDRGDFVDRMGTCIFDEAYKLHHVGRSVVQEVFGWVNREGIPICNGRTVKALRYLGAGVMIFS